MPKICCLRHNLKTRWLSKSTDFLIRYLWVVRDLTDQGWPQLSWHQAVVGTKATQFVPHSPLISGTLRHGVPLGKSRSTRNQPKPIDGFKVCPAFPSLTFLWPKQITQPNPTSMEPEINSCSYGRDCKLTWWRVCSRGQMGNTRRPSWSFLF